MTEVDWITTGYPDKMLPQYLGTGGTEARKSRLVACAFVRRIWHMLGDQRSRVAVEVAECYADGKASDENLEVAFTATMPEGDGGGCQVPIELDSDAAVAAAYAAAPNYQAGACLSAWHAAWAVMTAGENPWISGAAERAAQADLIRELLGNPFRPVRIDSACLAWNGGTVVKLAQGIYDDRAFDRLPVLADAIEEAGCHDPAILDHCRLPGEHVRGCWVVDLLLAKE